MGDTAANRQRMKHYISLGFSCLTRFTIDTFSADHRAMPYDWLVSTKSFLLETLTHLDGREFIPSTEEMQVYTTETEKIEGPYKDGAWFWHDFPRSNSRLAENWRSENNFSEKYPVLWERFLNLVRDDSRKKVFVLTNAQSNLHEFLMPPSDFADHYGIDTAYLEQLHQKLEMAGAKNFEILVLLRNIWEFVNIALNCKLPNLDARFAGPLNLPFNLPIARSLIQPAEPEADLQKLVGFYDNGVRFVPTAFNSLLILADGKMPWGVARSYADGYIISSVGPANNIYRAIEQDGGLYLSNKERWQKIAA